MSDKPQSNVSDAEKSVYERWEIPSLQEPPEIDEAESAESIVEQLPSLDEIEKIRQDAYDEGFKQGKSDGLAAGLTTGRATSDKRLLELLNAFGSPMQAQDKRLEDVLLMMISKLCRQVIQRELLLDSAVICSVIKAFFDEIEDVEKKCCIKLNPVDIERVKIFLADQYPHVQQCRLEADKNISAGGCIFSSDAHYIDALVETRINIMINDVYDQYDAPCPAPLPEEVVDLKSHNEVSATPESIIEVQNKKQKTIITEVDKADSDAVQKESPIQKGKERKGEDKLQEKENSEINNENKVESAVIAAEHGHTAQKVSISDMPFFDVDEESSSDS